MDCLIPPDVFQDVVSIFLSNEDKLKLRHTSSVFKELITLEMIFHSRIFKYHQREAVCRPRTLPSWFCTSVVQCIQNLTLTCKKSTQDFNLLYQTLPTECRRVKHIIVANPGINIGLMEKIPLYPLLETIHIQFIYFNSNCGLYGLTESEHLPPSTLEGIHVSIGLVEVLTYTADEALRFFQYPIPLLGAATQAKEISLNIYASINTSNIESFCSSKMPKWWSDCDSLKTKSWSILLNPRFGNVTNFKNLLLDCHEFEGDEYIDHALDSTSYFYNDIREALKYLRLSTQVPHLPSVKNILITLDVLAHWVDEAIPIYEDALRVIFSSVVNIEKIEYFGLVSLIIGDVWDTIVSLAKHSPKFKKHGFVVSRYNWYYETCVTVCCLDNRNPPDERPGRYWKLILESEYRISNGGWALVLETEYN